MEVRPVLVQRVLTPGSGRESWTLLGDDGEVVEPAERYLAYLAAIERSPNTVRAYAISLKLWFEFLVQAAVSWDPPPSPRPTLAATRQHCQPRTMP
jgi:hypothetical protein